ncbi:MAG: hypothetical protein KDD54_02530 [Flavobacteriales bacterium]|nr:hypothetical protein [Flavobacteriales bacterium]
MGKLAFQCNEDWEKMTPSERGRICAACQREVIDFTHLSKKEFKEALKMEKQPFCGQYREDQLYGGWAPELKVPKGLQRFALLSSLLLFFKTAGAGASATASASAWPQEIRDTVPPDSIPTAKEHVVQKTECAGSDSQPTPEKEKKSKYDRRRLYFNGRFPFIHYGKRRLRTLGMVAF